MTTLAAPELFTAAFHRHVEDEAIPFRQTTLRYRAADGRHVKFPQIDLLIASSFASLKKEIIRVSQTFSENNPPLV